MDTQLVSFSVSHALMANGMTQSQADAQAGHSPHFA
jgi:hypothetical protein